MHDVIILGAGPAGLSAALWCDQLCLDTLILERNAEIGGQLLSIYNAIDNYPGLRATTGRELLSRFSEQIAKADFDLWTNADIKNVKLKAKQISLSSGEELQSIALIMATGVRRRQLGIPGEKEFIGHGLIESATRDRELFAGKDVCVIGGGDAAVENALLLAEVCPTVTIVCRSKSLRSRREFVEEVQTNHRLTLFTESSVTRIIGKEAVEGVEIVRKDALKPFQMAVQGVVIRVGLEPNNDLFRQQLKVDELGYALVNSEHETNVSNVFAIGDISNPRAPTISGAVGAGATAAKVIAERLNKG